MIFEAITSFKINIMTKTYLVKSKYFYYKIQINCIKYITLELL